MKHNGNLMAKKDLLRVLDKFLVDNIELEELSAKLSIFNIFSVLRVEKVEIRHSNVIAWLLDPQGSHGLGQAFLRRILSTILLDNESSLVNINPAKIELMDMRDVEVWREWRNIDLLAFSQSNKWILLIENKMKARATKRQLVKYMEIIAKEFQKFIVIPVLLTFEEDDASDIAEDAGYISWSHAQMYHVASHIFNQRRDRIPQDAKIFLEHYLVILRRLTMQDEEIVSLCKEIYRKHKDAIDLIVEWGAATQFGAVAETFISANKNLLQLCLRTNSLWFIPRSWTKRMPACSNRWKFLSTPYPIACWFNFRSKRSKIGLIVEIGSMEDQEKRLKLVNAFNSHGFNIGKKAFRAESKFTRVYSIYLNITDIDDRDEIQKLMDSLWLKTKPKIETTTEIIESFKW